MSTSSDAERRYREMHKNDTTEDLEELLHFFAFSTDSMDPDEIAAVLAELGGRQVKLLPPEDPEEAYRSFLENYAGAVPGFSVSELEETGRAAKAAGTAQAAAPRRRLRHLARFALIAAVTAAALAGGCLAAGALRHRLRGQAHRRRAERLRFGRGKSDAKATKPNEQLCDLDHKAA